MKTFILVLFAAASLVACKQNQNPDANSSTDTMEVEQTATDDMDMSNDAQDLTQYEYVCSHCQVGSHEPGTCACGMEYEQNPDFAGNMDADDDHEGHDH